MQKRKLGEWGDHPPIFTWKAFAIVLGFILVAGLLGGVIERIG